MKFLVTACLLSERLKPRPKPGIQAFFERSEIAIPFATYLTIERGLEMLARNHAEKAVQLRGDIMALLVGCEFIHGYDAEIAHAMARILGHGPLRHTWLPNEKAKGTVIRTLSMGRSGIPGNGNPDRRRQDDGPIGRGRPL